MRNEGGSEAHGCVSEHEVKSSENTVARHSQDLFFFFVTTPTHTQKKDIL